MTTVTRFAGDLSGFNYIQRNQYIREVKEIRKSLRTKIPQYINLNSTIFVGASRPKQSLGRVTDWYVNVRNGVIFLKTARWGWRVLLKLIGGNETTNTIYAYSEERPDRPLRDLNIGWSTVPITVIPTGNRSIWFSKARYVDGFRVSVWTPPALLQGVGGLGEGAGSLFEIQPNTTLIPKEDRKVDAACLVGVVDMGEFI